MKCISFFRITVVALLFCFVATMANAKQQYGFGILSEKQFGRQPFICPNGVCVDENHVGDWVEEAARVAPDQRSIMITLSEGGLASHFLFLLRCFAVNDIQGVDLIGPNNSYKALVLKKISAGVKEENTNSSNQRAIFKVLDQSEFSNGDHFQDSSGKNLSVKALEEQISEIAQASPSLKKPIGLHVAKGASSTDALTILILLAKYQIQDVTILGTSFEAIHLEDFYLKPQTK